MTDPNWGLLGGNSALNMFQFGAQLGTQKRQEREQREQQNAMLELRAKQEERLAQRDQREMARQDQADKRADLPLMERLLTGVTPENYGQRLQIAQQYGVDVSQLPQAYDPAWVDQQLGTVKLLNTPQGQEALSNAGKQAMDMGYRPGTPEFAAVARQLVTASLAQPYTGSQGETRLYTPQIGGMGQVRGGIEGPQPGVVEDGYRFKGGDPADQNNWEPVAAGGPTQPASGGFRPVGLPGETVTSTRRSAAHNRAVGGVSNSYHLSGRARDSVPPPGMSMSAYYQRLKALNPHLDVINEGDHVHMEPRG